MVTWRRLHGYQLKEMPDGKGFSVVFNQRIGRINLLRSDEQIRLNLQVSGPVRYSVKRLASPNRIVIDLEGATFVAGATGLVSVTAQSRSSHQPGTPTTARLVMDLTHSLEIVDIDTGDNEREIDPCFSIPVGGDTHRERIHWGRV